MTQKPLCYDQALLNIVRVEFSKHSLLCASFPDKPKLLIYREGCMSMPVEKFDSVDELDKNAGYCVRKYGKTTESKNYTTDRFLPFSEAFNQRIAKSLVKSWREYAISQRLSYSNPLPKKVIKLRNQLMMDSIDLVEINPDTSWLSPEKSHEDRITDVIKYLILLGADVLTMAYGEIDFWSKPSLHSLGSYEEKLSTSLDWGMAEAIVKELGIGGSIILFYGLSI